MKLNMTITEQVKMLDDKIKSNKAQYDLDRQAAKTTALPSKDLEKYKYLTGEDLGCKPDVIQRAKFEYSPLGEAFNIVFKKDDKNLELRNVSVVIRCAFSQTNIIIINYLDTGVIGFK